MGKLDELREQIADSICDACLETHEYGDGTTCPYERWGEEKCQTVKDATPKILAIPLIASPSCCARCSRFEVAVVDNKAELPKLPQVIVPPSREDAELTNLGYAYIRAQLDMRNAGWRKVVSNEGQDREHRLRESWHRCDLGE